MPQSDQAGPEMNGTSHLNPFRRSSAICARWTKRERDTPRRSTPCRTMSWRKKLTIPSQTQHAMTRQSAPRPRVGISKKRARRSQTRRAMSGFLSATTKFLREQVSKKDEQISDLSKRFSETQILLGAMQKMLAPMLGQADPFNTPEKREVQDSRTS